MTELTVTTPTWTETSISVASITERYPTPEGKSTYWESTTTTWGSEDTPVIWIGMYEVVPYSEAD
jgi:hypothetical protein